MQVFQYEADGSLFARCFDKHTEGFEQCQLAWCGGGLSIRPQLARRSGRWIANRWMPRYMHFPGASNANPGRIWSGYFLIGTVADQYGDVLCGCNVGQILKQGRFADTSFTTEQHESAGTSDRLRQVRLQERPLIVSANKNCGEPLMGFICIAAVVH
ncbi:MAG: hypothetical protein M9890_02170 [Thermomicrobiales bacterium]|nr:hypothetical protein [Thermomicrobiales bacterium]